MENVSISAYIDDDDGHAQGDSWQYSKTSNSVRPRKKRNISSFQGRGC